MKKLIVGFLLFGASVSQAQYNNIPGYLQGIINNGTFGQPSTSSQTSTYDDVPSIVTTQTSSLTDSAGQTIATNMFIVTSIAGVTVQVLSQVAAGSLQPDGTYAYTAWNFVYSVNNPPEFDTNVYSMQTIDAVEAPQYVVPTMEYINQNASLDSNIEQAATEGGNLSLGGDDYGDDGGSVGRWNDPLQGPGFS